MSEPLTPADCDLRGMPFMPLDVVRLVDSDLMAVTTGDEFKAAVTLWCKCWLQVPAASLPDDDRILAHLSGAGARWRKMKAGALHGFVLCDDGRWYHSVIAEKAREAWKHRQKQRDKANKRWGNADGTSGEGGAGTAPADAVACAGGDAVASAAAMQGRGRGTVKIDSPPASPPATARDWSTLKDLLSITNELCDVAGVPRPTEQAKAAGQMDTVKAWLDAGIDPEADIVPAITVEITKNEGPSFSLKRFDAAVRHYHRKRLAIAKDPKLAPPEPRKPARPIVFEHDGETAEMARFRRQLAGAIDETKYRVYFEACAIVVEPERVRVLVPLGLLSTAHGNHAADVERIAKRVFGVRLASIEALHAQAA